MLSSLCRGARCVCSARCVMELGVCTQLAMSCVYSARCGARCVCSARYVMELGVCTQLAMSWS